MKYFLILLLSVSISSAADFNFDDIKDKFIGFVTSAQTSTNSIAKVTKNGPDYSLDVNFKIESSDVKYTAEQFSVLGANFIIKAREIWTILKK